MTARKDYLPQSIGVWYATSVLKLTPPTGNFKPINKHLMIFCSGTQHVCSTDQHDQNPEQKGVDLPRRKSATTWKFYF